MTKRLATLSFIALTCLLFGVGYQFVRSNMAADFYRDRLREEVEKREAMRQSFNEVVKKTVVTELLVQDDESICVVFVNADNTERIVPTPFKRGAVVYVDFIVQDNRVLLRRVYDENTPPSQALVLDPEMQTIDWKKVDDLEGNAPFARLNKKGRWVVTVTGNNALALTKADDNAKRQPLTYAPTVKDYDVIEKEITAQVEEIGIGDVMSSIFGGKK